MDNRACQLLAEMAIDNFAHIITESKEIENLLFPLWKHLK